MVALLALAYLAGINLITWWLFSLDKKRAVQRDWRIPEKALINAALLGGWPAAKLAQRRLRHKNRKQPFGRVLNAVSVIWIGLGLLGLYFAHLKTT